ncbi:hypothetical protein Pyn_38282 [Prunus yedoensis var. nudiflora]|uniref:Uncharacterized protein n=1 Tax=Prunus yedoensis var. nudiflora TaxID=2094558 RepID=A0A314ZXL5_PRUYE|nr:hypothetical protein Pyn_38282 [Prunus yedoensis var. nudiflora]
MQQPQQMIPVMPTSFPPTNITHRANSEVRFLPFFLGGKKQPLQAKQGYIELRKERPSAEILREKFNKAGKPLFYSFMVE